MQWLVEPTTNQKATPKRLRLKSKVVRLLRLAGVPLGSTGSKEIAESLTWLILQQRLVLERFPIEQNDWHTAEGFGPDDYWPQKLQKFVHRANLLTLESPEGHQAIAELAAACIGLLASTWRVYGPPSSYTNSILSSVGIKRE